MIKLIENKEIRDKLGKNGRKIVEQKYTWKKVNEDIEEIYNQVIKEKKN
jgi:glycosyltransferase involved in cell wall biosynthesis